MQSVWSCSRLAVVLLAAGECVACTGAALSGPSALGPVTPALEPSAIDESALCSKLSQHFVGLPEVGASSGSAPTPSLGRWWIRGCHARPRGAELEVQLAGPGWYWVDQSGSGMRVRQQVPFQLELSLRGTLHLESSERVLALWLEPSRDPAAHARGPSALDVQSTSGWGALLSIVPGVTPKRRAAEHFEAALTQAFRERLRAGITFTFNVATGQADAAVGRLAPGQTPTRPFAEDEEWIINDRLRLPPAAAQVLGPIEPGSTRLDVIVESGPGLVYRALCAPELEASFGVIASGRLTDVPRGAWRASGSFHGLGERTTELRVPDCKFFVVASTLDDTTTLASLRVRVPATTPRTPPD